MIPDRSTPLLVACSTRTAPAGMTRLLTRLMMRCTLEALRVETLGGIRNVLLQHGEVLREFAEPSEIDAAIAYIDKTFGRG